MDAKERLRRYLEQRRELGESEMVLDRMSVDDVLAVIGARASAPRVASNPRGAAPTPPGEPNHASVDVTLSALSPAPPIVSPATRFDSAHPTDWRTALRGPVDTPAPTSTTGHEAPTSPAAVPAWMAALDLPTGITIGGGAATASESNAVATLLTLADVAASARTCTRCALHATATNVVPGEGNPNAELVCVGEAPGANEDAQGRPFVGDAGALLTKILQAIHLQRDDVFICNVLKHRPPMNRDPLPEEVLACQPYLLRQLELVRPRVILALGRFAAQTLLRTTTPIGKLRGQLHAFHGTPLIVTYHPAALLRNEAWKRPTWDDVRLARRVLDASREAVARPDSSA